MVSPAEETEIGDGNVGVLGEHQECFHLILVEEDLDHVCKISIAGVVIDGCFLCPLDPIIDLLVFFVEIFGVLIANLVGE